MHAEIQVIQGSACDLSALPALSIDLVVTSPPYPMVAMWDGVFSAQDDRIQTHLDHGEGRDAFEAMHRILDAAWAECDRVLKPGGIACINIGDATRTIDGDFQLYSNHSRILRTFLDRGYAALPDILWRKQTNAPNKFMGSGMLPVGAYVTYEHEYILVLRKGRRRRFTTDAEKRLRMESAFFWEERNVWFSDIWTDVKGTAQALADASARERSAAYPFELAYRLISMYSIKGDRVLDPFAGTGTTLAAALAACRNAVGVELDGSLAATAWEALGSAQHAANEYNADRIRRHLNFVSERTAQKGSLKHVNRHYGFPVMTRQETELLIPVIAGVGAKGERQLSVEYRDNAQETLRGI